LKAGVMKNIDLFTCDYMQRTIEDGESGLIYIPNVREFGIRVLDGGSSFLVIQYCPWCGKRLPSSLHDEWFRRLESLGIDDSRAAPEDMKSDMWWQRQGLQ
jgi:hypothetical protein